MVCTLLFIVIVEPAAPTFFICDHSLRASSSAHVQNCARNSTYKCTCQKNTGHAWGAMDQRLIHAEHLLSICCAFVGWDVANTHRDIELPPYLWCNWWQARKLHLSFKQWFHILGNTIVTITKNSTPLSSRHLQMLTASLSGQISTVWDLC